MKIPKKVKIGSLTYNVVYSKPIADAKNAYGITSHDDQEITLDPSMKADRLDEVFLHELLHACFHTSGLQRLLEDDNHKFDEEQLVNIIGYALIAVIKDNKLNFNAR